VSAERIRDEFLRLLGGPRVSAAVRALDLLGLLQHIVPEAAALKGLAQPPPHVYDGWAHTTAALDRLEAVFSVLGPTHDPEAAADLPLGLAAVRLGRWRERLAGHFADSLSGDRPLRALLFLAALMHDMGKPATKTVEAEGRIRFIGHEQVGADLAYERATQLRLSVDEAKRVRTVVAGHMRPLLLANEAGGPSARAVHRYFRALGAAGVEVCVLALADTLATWGPEFNQAAWSRLTEVVAALLKAYYEEHEQVVAPPALVNGTELIAELGLAEGPWVGQLLEAIREAQAAGEVADREAALALARRLIGETGYGKISFSTGS
jgi:putative nucleotidyltransferase with HDIG domain